MFVGYSYLSQGRETDRWDAGRNDRLHFGSDIRRRDEAEDETQIYLDSSCCPVLVPKLLGIAWRSLTLVPSSRSSIKSAGDMKRISYRSLIFSAPPSPPSHVHFLHPILQPRTSINGLVRYLSRGAVQQPRRRPQQINVRPQE